MFCKVTTATVAGLEVREVSVEVNVTDGLPMLEMIGMLAGEVKEARERVRNALINTGIRIPPKRITINLAPADLRKSGSGFDLAIAVALLVCFGIFSQECVENKLFFGELGLDGSIQKIRGILPMVAFGKEKGITTCFVPAENGKEGALIRGVDVVPILSLSQLIQFLKDKEQQTILPVTGFTSDKEDSVDFSDIQGQSFVKRGAEIAVAGRHNLFLFGSPGTGKSMTAKRLPTIFPELTEEERLEITKIYSVAGLLPGESVVIKRPFRSPHHTITPKGMAGGGRVPKPGEITLAEKGVLFLDEIPEFSRSVIEVLRQPLEDRKITISRTEGNYTFPADFLLVAACNPCPCGYYPDRNRCQCTEYERKKYLGKLSGPFLDRMDLWVEAPEITYQDLTRKRSLNISSNDMKKRVEAARERQKIRYRNTFYQCNGELSSTDTEKYCVLGTKERKIAEEMFETWKLSARSYYKLLKVARTIADLDGEEKISEEHLMEAGAYRKTI